MVTREELLKCELKRRAKSLKKYENKLIAENWFKVLLDTKEYSKKKDSNFKIIHELIQFFNNSGLNQVPGYVYLMKFIMEVNYDFKASRILAFTGCYKQARSSLRTALENAFRLVYFKQHPNSLTRLSEEQMYSLMNDKINDVIFTNRRLNNRIKKAKNDLSKSTHTSPRNLNSGIMVLSFKKDKYKEWLKDLNKAQKLILEMINNA